MHARQRSPELAAGPVRAIRTALDPAHVAASVCCTCLLLPCCCLALLLAYPLCAIVPAAAVSVSVSLETALMPPAPPPPPRLCGRFVCVGRADPGCAGPAAARRLLSVRRHAVWEVVATAGLPNQKTVKHSVSNQRFSVPRNPASGPSTHVNTMKG